MLKSNIFLIYFVFRIFLFDFIALFLIISIFVLIYAYSASLTPPQIILPVIKFVSEKSMHDMKCRKKKISLVKIIFVFINISIMFFC